MNIKNLIYAIACLSFSVVIGAAVYEHVAVVPHWAAAPPVSLSMFQGKYGLDPAPFWKAIHPVTLFLLIVSIALFWKSGRRRYLLITFTGYVLVLIITFVYFVPQLLAITGTAYDTISNATLTKQAQLWETLSMVRLAFLIILALVAFGGMSVGSKVVGGKQEL